MTEATQTTRPITADMFPCPVCGAVAVGTIDTLVCRWSTHADGTVTDWQGNDLDTQEPLDREGRPVLVCENGHDYTHDAFTAEVMQTLRIEGGDPMSVQGGTRLPLDIRITLMPEYDDNDQYIGACTINGVPHHITLFRVIGDDHEQDAAPGHHYRFDALRAFEADVEGFLPLDVNGRDYLCVMTPQSI